MIYDLETLIEELQKGQKTKHIYLRPLNRKWRNNHNLCIRNYEKMKQSRKRIIKQRDNLKQQNIGLIKQIERLKKYSKLQQENNNLYTSLESANAKILKLEQEIDRLTTEKFENTRMANLLQQVLDGKI